MAADEADEILVLISRIDPADLVRLLAKQRGVMVKYVVDLEERVIAIGGEMHADAEAVLLERGSKQRNLWGANYFPGRGPEGCVSSSSLINIRPSQGNRSMEIQDDGIKKLVKEITFELVGSGEPL